MGRREYGGFRTTGHLASAIRKLPTGVVVQECSPEWESEDYRTPTPAETTALHRGFGPGRSPRSKLNRKESQTTWKSFAFFQKVAHSGVGIFVNIAVFTEFRLATARSPDV